VIGEVAAATTRGPVVAFFAAGPTLRPALIGLIGVLLLVAIATARLLATFAALRGTQQAPGHGEKA
jgi:hypothetical protein